MYVRNYGYDMRSSFPFQRRSDLQLQIRLTGLPGEGVRANFVWADAAMFLLGIYRTVLVGSTKQS